MCFLGTQAQRLFLGSTVAFGLGSAANHLASQIAKRKGRKWAESPNQRSGRERQWVDSCWFAPLIVIVAQRACGSVWFCVPGILFIPQSGVEAQKAHDLFPFSQQGQKHLSAKIFKQGSDTYSRHTYIKYTYITLLFIAVLDLECYSIGNYFTLHIITLNGTPDHTQSYQTICMQISVYGIQWDAVIVTVIFADVLFLVSRYGTCLSHLKPPSLLQFLAGHSLQTLPWRLGREWGRPIFALGTTWAPLTPVQSPGWKPLEICTGQPGSWAWASIYSLSLNHGIEVEWRWNGGANVPNLLWVWQRGWALLSTTASHYKKLHKPGESAKKSAKEVRVLVVSAMSVFHFGVT